MKKNVLLCLTLFYSTQIICQENHYISIGFESNSQYYLDDSKTGNFLEKNRFRSNNYFKLDYQYKKFYSGIQLESYEPNALLNYSPNLDKTNLGVFFLGYKNDVFNLKLGHFYEQFGNGLILRAWEDRQLGINSAILGAKMTYSPTKYLQFSTLYGKQRKGFHTSNGKIFGFNSEINLTQLLHLKNSYLDLGFSYIGRNQQSTFSNPTFKNLTNSFSTRLDFSKGNFSTNIEYVSKSKDAIIIQNQIKNTKTGSAFLANFGYSKKGIGINTTFRRTENMNFYSEREATGNNFNQSLINFIPALTKQHDYLLTNIYVYQAQPQVSFQDPSLMKSGEIGGQIDLFFNLKRKTAFGGKYGTKIALNFSQWHGLKGYYNYTNFEYSTNFLSFGQRYYTDFNLEIRKKISPKWNSIFYYVNQYYNKRYIEETIGSVKTNIVVSEATYKFNHSNSIRIEAQHLWTKDDKKNWFGATIEYNFKSNFSIYLNDIYNYGNNNYNQRIHYYNIGGNYTSRTTRVNLNYGRQRGGLLCVGGVCRYVPESTGISANINFSL